MAAPTRKKVFDIVGESRDATDGTPRQNLLAKVDPGDEVSLQRQPDNPHDPNAVAVLWNGKDIGFLSREDAAAFAPALDDGVSYAARVHELKGGVKGFASYGAKIAIAWEGNKLPAFRPLDEEQERSRRGQIAAMGRERDASGAFTGGNAEGEPKGGCMGVLVGFVLVGAAGLYSFV
ncbi:HIRAN domain-containing protein [Erythrobacter sp.]|uniref:HIRAN domain-containing protein n=1 Tax=Erythrobacter sp. TaxID=1042 RepID=UPI001425F6DE|nr:HIRAN domain-containing protein [Erythrobacter sp.]QIQ87073.1 MAG: hypothetical protein G9473_10540 [Erythrobacter sp.]